MASSGTGAGNIINKVKEYIPGTEEHKLSSQLHGEGLGHTGGIGGTGVGSGTTGVGSGMGSEYRDTGMTGLTGTGHHGTGLGGTTGTGTTGMTGTGYQSTGMTGLTGTGHHGSGMTGMTGTGTTGSGLASKIPGTEAHRQATAGDPRSATEKIKEYIPGTQEYRASH